MRQKNDRNLTVFFAAVLLLQMSACSVKGSEPKTAETSQEDMVMSSVPEATGEVPQAEATGEKTERTDKVCLDYSNTPDGYVMVSYTGDNQKVKVRVTGPSGTEYTYNLVLNGDFDVLPLSDGSGNYAVSVFENTSGTKYSTIFYFELNVSLKDEFEPFLRPNKYVNFSSDSLVAKKAAEITAGRTETLDKISAIYDFTVSNISYDYEKAESVQSGYIPQVDEVLTEKKGICFDYATVMTAMLRSIGIPTKLVVGYTGSLYHAWINTYSSESGWVEASIYFDGTKWKLMDPTFASNADSEKEILDYIGNGANYTAKYLY